MAPEPEGEGVVATLVEAATVALVVVMGIVATTGKAASAAATIPIPPEPCSLPSPGWTQALCSAPLHLVIRSIFFKIREMPETGSQC